MKKQGDGGYAKIHPRLNQPSLPRHLLPRCYEHTLSLPAKYCPIVLCLQNFHSTTAFVRKRWLIQSGMWLWVLCFRGSLYQANAKRYGILNLIGFLPTKPTYGILILKRYELTHSQILSATHTHKCYPDKTQPTPQKPKQKLLNHYRKMFF